MKLKRKYVISSLLFIMCLLSNIITVPTVQAATDNKKPPYIIDDANILSNDDKLDDLANKYSEKYNTSIIVITTDDTEGLSTVDYASNYYDTYIHGQDGYNDDCVLFLIDMEHRNVNIYAYEDAAIRMNTPRCNKILDNVTPKLSDGDYDDAAKTFIKETYTYLGEAPDSNTNNTSVNYSGTYSGTNSDTNADNIFFKLWFQILISVIIGATVVVIMIFNSGGRITTNSSTYLDHNNSRLTGSFDHYIRTTTKRVKKPDNNNNGGGSSGGTTSGGSSFSSGSERSF